jgi:hypothetical protein
MYVCNTSHLGFLNTPSDYKDYIATNDMIIINYFIRKYVEFWPFLKTLYQHLKGKTERNYKYIDIYNMIPCLLALIQTGDLPDMRQEH